MTMKKYKVNARIVTKSISGYVMANSGEEAYNKFMARQDVEDYQEQHDCETIEATAEEVK